MCSFRERELVVPNIYLVRFNLPCSTGVLPCGLGKYVNLKTVANGEDVVRSYSPISRPSAVGQVDFLIKVSFVLLCALRGATVATLGLRLMRLLRVLTAV